MRLAANPDSPYFDPSSQWADVTVDGVPVIACLEACEEEGWAICARFDTDGRLVIDRTTNDVATVRHEGSVVITIRPEGP